MPSGIERRKPSSCAIVVSYTLPWLGWFVAVVLLEVKVLQNIQLVTHRCRHGILACWREVSTVNGLSTIVLGDWGIFMLRQVTQVPQFDGAIKASRDHRMSVGVKAGKDNHIRKRAFLNGKRCNIIVKLDTHLRVLIFFSLHFRLKVTFPFDLKSTCNTVPIEVDKKKH